MLNNMLNKISFFCARFIELVFLRQELWTWTKLCSCIGSICFLISDTLLGFHYFHTPLPYSQVYCIIFL